MICIMSSHNHFQRKYRAFFQNKSPNVMWHNMILSRTHLHFMVQKLLHLWDF